MSVSTKAETRDNDEQENDIFHRVTKILCCSVSYTF